MLQVSQVLADLDALDRFLSVEPVASACRTASSVLVQLYLAHDEPEALSPFLDRLHERLPQALVLGATTVGEIVAGRTQMARTVIGLSCFAHAHLRRVSALVARGEERAQGRMLRSAMDAVVAEGLPLRGMLLLAAPKNLDAAALLSGLGETSLPCPVFGGGAGSYQFGANSWVVDGTTMATEQVVAVMFIGTDLHIELRSYLGWRPLSKQMRITGLDGMRLLSLDGEAPLEVYRRYLGIDVDADFFRHSLEFPLLVERDGVELARVAQLAHADGSLQFVADLREGEKVRLGCGDPEVILAHADGLRDALQHAGTEAIWLYSCICRRFLMQEDVERETLPFQDVAPTFGFYTYGEFFAGEGRCDLLNATLVAVGLREGPAPEPSACQASGATTAPAADAYANQHSRVLTRLLHFIGAVGDELRQANSELLKLSVTDKLTQVHNRLKLDQLLQDEVRRTARHDYLFAVILLDIDHFKQINDSKGHAAGDAVLRELAALLRDSVRAEDQVGRWGGEEFLLVLPHTSAAAAAHLAEKMRQRIATNGFTTGGQVTASLGVAEYRAGESEHELLIRADAALYRAKHGGRNRVETD